MINIKARILNNFRWKIKPACKIRDFFHRIWNGPKTQKVLTAPERGVPDPPRCAAEPPAWGSSEGRTGARHRTGSNSWEWHPPRTLATTSWISLVIRSPSFERSLVQFTRRTNGNWASGRCVVRFWIITGADSPPRNPQDGGQLSGDGIIKSGGQRRIWSNEAIHPGPRLCQDPAGHPRQKRPPLRIESNAI